MNKEPQSLAQLILRIISTIIVFTFLIQIICIIITFNIFNKQKKSSVEILSSQLVSKIEEQFNSCGIFQDYISSNSSVHNFLSDANSNKMSSLNRQISDNIRFANRFYEDNFSVILIDNNNKFHSILNVINESEKDKITDIYNEYISDGEKNSTSLFKITTDAYETLYICSIQPIKMLNTKVVSSNELGTAVVLSRLNIYRELSSMQYQTNAGLELTNGVTGDKISFTDSTKGKNALISQEKRISGSNWFLNGFLVYTNQNSSIFYIFVMFLIELVILILIVSTLQITLLNKYVKKPIISFVNFLDNYEMNNSIEPIEINSTQEYSMISRHINIMIENSRVSMRKIIHAQQKLYEAELCEKEAILYTLQNQINPHFLYNTLDCISAISLSQDPSEIPNITKALSDIFRYSLSQSDNVTVGDEILILQKYLFILKIRLSDKLDVDFDFDDDIWEKKVFCMLFQPIIENSFKHGFNSPNKKYTLKISGQISDQDLIFTFHDNGSGISPERLKQLEKELNECCNMNYSNQGLGLINTQRRIHMLYGKEYGIKVTSIQGEYTCVTVTLPNLE